MADTLLLLRVQLAAARRDVRIDGKRAERAYGARRYKLGQFYGAEARRADLMVDVLAARIQEQEAQTT